MKVFFDIYVEGTSLRKQGMFAYLIDLTISHQHSTGKGRGKGGFVRKGKPGHTATLNLWNPKHVHNGYFKKLDKADIWLGVDDYIYYQGCYRIKSIKYTSDAKSCPKISISFICRTYEATRKRNNANYEGYTFNEFAEKEFSDMGAKYQIDDILKGSKINISKSALTSSYEAVHNAALEMNAAVHATYDAKTKVGKSGTPTIEIKKERFSFITGPDGKPLSFTYGTGDLSNAIFSYDITIDDIDKKTGNKGGTASDTGDTTKSKNTKVGGTGNPGPTTSYKTPAGEDLVLETSPVVPAGALSSQSASLYDAALVGDLEAERDVVFSFVPVVPRPYMFPGIYAQIKNIPAFDGYLEVDKVDQVINAKKFLTTTIGGKKRSEEDVKTMGKPQSAVDTRNAQKTKAGDSPTTAYKTPAGEDLVLETRIVDATTDPNATMSVGPET